MVADPVPCVLPKRPAAFSIAAVRDGETALYAEIGRAATEWGAYADAVERCQKANKL